MILAFEDGTTAIFENVEGFYRDQDNWKEGQIPGKVIEKWVEHEVRWTSDRVRA